MNECRYCKRDFDHEPIEEEYCSQGCYQNACERWYQRSIEDYYGGDTPQTEYERYVMSAAEKRRIG